jgi:RNA polymerase sigma factor (sigma-70 family)
MGQRGQYRQRRFGYKPRLASGMRHSSGHALSMSSEQPTSNFSVAVETVAPANDPPNGPVTLARADQTQTFEEFFAANHQRMLRLAAALLPSQAVAEDVVQDAFIKSYVHFASLTHPSAYLRRSIINQSTSYFRKRGIATRKEPLLRPAPSLSEHDTMLSVLEKLPSRQRAALVLRYYEQCTEAEIAYALKCRPGTVKSLLSRGIAALREVIDHD